MSHLMLLLVARSVFATPVEIPAAYAAIFVDQATWRYAIEEVNDDGEGDGEPKQSRGECRVSARREPERMVAVVTCDKGMSQLAGTYTADKRGLWAATDGPKELLLPTPLAEKTVTWPRRRAGKVVVRFEKTAEGWCRERQVGDMMRTTTRTCFVAGPTPITLVEEFVNRGPMLSRTVTFTPYR